MCGIVGVAGQMDLKDEDLMRRLLWLDYFRGQDSTGFAAITNDGVARIVREASHPADLFDRIKFRSALNGKNSSVFLGHNRAATKGRISIENTHPFMFEHIVGVHNGTLDLYSQRLLEKELGTQFEVDSQAVIAAIAAFGPKETLKMMTGSWSIVYVDILNGTLNFIRNIERPMWLAHTKDFKRLIFASEWNFIDQAALYGTYNEDLYTNKEGNAYFATAIDTHYTFEIEALKTATKKPKPKISIMKGGEKPPFTDGYGFGRHYSPWHDDEDWANDQRNLHLGENVIPITRENSGKQAPIHLEGTKEKPFAGRITETRFNELMAASGNGCSWCGEEIKWGDTGLTIFDTKDKILCPKCCTSGFTGATRIYVR